MPTREIQSESLPSRNLRSVRRDEIHLWVTQCRQTLDYLCPNTHPWAWMSGQEKSILIFFWKFMWENGGKPGGLRWTHEEFFMFVTSNTHRYISRISAGVRGKTVSEETLHPVTWCTPPPKQSMLAYHCLEKFCAWFLTKSYLYSAEHFLKNRK